MSDTGSKPTTPPEALAYLRAAVAILEQAGQTSAIIGDHWFVSRLTPMARDVEIEAVG